MKLPFCLVSKAYSPSKHAPPVEGIRRLAESAHALGIPITWIVEPVGCEVLKVELLDWHVAYGDEIAMSLSGLPTTAEAYRRRRDSLQSICPWSSVTISGQGGQKSEAMLEALEVAGIEGHWGYCWEQTYVDGITDYGQPPGLFHASRKSYKMPSPLNEGIVAIEWLSRDLNKAFWTGNPVHFAGEPDAFKVMGDWPDSESLAYFQHVVGQYLRNALAGQAIPFIFQEEAEQLMERLGGFYTGIWPSLINWINQALAPLAQNSEIEFTTLPAVVRRFRAGEWPWPRLYRASDQRHAPLHDPRDTRSRSKVYGSSLQFPEALHYCSSTLFATFRQGSPTPLRAIRYDRQQICDVSAPLEGEPILPQLLSLHRENGAWNATFLSETSTPFALCLPLEPGEEPPVAYPRNEDCWAWEFVVQSGRVTYVSPPLQHG